MHRVGKMKCGWGRVMAHDRVAALYSAEGKLVAGVPIGAKERWPMVVIWSGRAFVTLNPGEKGSRFVEVAAHFVPGHQSAYRATEAEALRAP